MKISYEEPKDLRIDPSVQSGESFSWSLWCRQYVFLPALVCIRTMPFATLGNWGIYVALILNTIFLAAVSMLCTKINYRMTFSKPIQELRGAARRVAGGDFTDSYSATAWRWQTG